MSARAFFSRVGPLTALPRHLRTLTTERIGRALLALALTIATLAVTVFAFRVLDDGMMHNNFGGDEGYFVWGGWSIIKGLRPYVDFQEFKPPFLFLTHALALKLYGYQNLQFRRFFLYFPLASVVALQLSLITRGIDKLLTMALAVAIVRVWVTPHFHDASLSDSESIGIAYYLFGVAFLLARSKLYRWTQALGGGFLVCCILSKEPFLPCAFMTWIGCFLMRDRGTNLRSAALQYLKYTAIGGLAVVIALCIYMVPTGSMRAYLAMASRYSVVYRDPAQSFCVLGGVFEPTTPANDFVRFLHRAQSDFFTISNLGALVPFEVACLAYCARRSMALFATALLAFGLALYSVNISNCPWFHYFNIALTGLFFCAIAGLDSMAPYFRASDRSTRALVRLLVVAAVAMEAWPKIDAEMASYGKRTFPSTDEAAGGTQEFVRSHTSPSDYIFTTGNPALYLRTDRIGAVRETTLLDPMLPFYVGDTDEEKLRPLYDELVAHKPKVVVLDQEFANRKVRHDKALFQPFLKTFGYTEARPHIFLRPD